MRRLRLWWLVRQWRRRRVDELRFAQDEAEVLADALVVLTAWDLWYGPDEIG